jgi:NOL1/NOP2/fmu family ribosome biogenesis protein
MQIIRSNEKKKILAQLNEQFGIKEMPHLLLRFGQDKIRAFSGSISADELLTLDKYLRIETTGIYLAKEQQDGLRLSLDGISLFNKQISKNILDLTDKQTEDWLKGNDLLIELDRSFKILRHNGYFIGCGKSTGQKITNFMPKERRIKG